MLKKNLTRMISLAFLGTLAMATTTSMADINYADRYNATYGTLENGNGGKSRNYSIWVFDSKNETATGGDYRAFSSKSGAFLALQDASLAIDEWNSQTSKFEVAPTLTVLSGSSPDTMSVATLFTKGEGSQSSLLAGSQSFIENNNSVGFKASDMVEMIVTVNGSDYKLSDYDLAANATIPKNGTGWYTRLLSGKMNNADGNEVSYTYRDVVFAYSGKVLYAVEAIQPIDLGNAGAVVPAATGSPLPGVLVSIAIGSVAGGYFRLRKARKH